MGKREYIRDREYYCSPLANMISNTNTQISTCMYWQPRRLKEKKKKVSSKNKEMDQLFNQINNIEHVSHLKSK